MRADGTPVKQPGMTNAEYLRTLRQRAVAQGKCYGCRARPVREGTRYCDECIERAAESERSYVARRMCINCCVPLPASCETQRCEACRDELNEATLERRATRRASGNCPRCGMRPPAVGYEVCIECAEDNRLRILKYNRKAGRRPRAGSCAICSALGLLGISHNSRTHERYMAHAAKWMGASGADRREPEEHEG